MKRRPAWLMRKIHGKRGKKQPKTVYSFTCQAVDDNTILVERVKSRKPRGAALLLLEGLDINITNEVSDTIDLCKYYTLLGGVQSCRDINAHMIPNRVIRLMRNDGFHKRSTDTTMKWGNVPLEIRGAAFPFQKDGISKSIVNFQGRVLIGDEMGLGKTIQAIGIVSYYRANWPCLILCPSFLKLNWRKEFLQWTTLCAEDICVVKNGKQVIPKTVQIVIMSYGLVSNMISQLKHLNFKAIIADEAHYLKNRKAARTKNTIGLLHSAKTSILLTGTPMCNRPEECFTLISALRPVYVGKWKEFVLRYCDAKQSLFGFDVSGRSNTRELSYLLRKTCMMRRLKRDVLKDLPSKLRSQIVVQLTATEMKAMKPLQDRVEVINKAIFRLSPGSEECRAMVFERQGIICKLFHLNDTAKGKVVSEILMEQLGQVEKIVVFCFHMSMMNTLEEKMKEKRVSYMRIDGSTPTEKRQIYVDNFQDKDVDCQVALLSIGAANSGLTLTAAHTMLFASLHWVPSEICQAEDRCHRIGQENKVDIRYVIAKGTIDDKMFAKINRKLSVTNSILNADTDDGVGFSGEVVEFERPCREVEEKQSQSSNDPTVSPVDTLTTLDPLGLF